MMTLIRKQSIILLFMRIMIGMGEMFSELLFSDFKKQKIILIKMMIFISKT